jgi:hypothetical protein
MVHLWPIETGNKKQGEKSMYPSTNFQSNQSILQEFETHYGVSTAVEEDLPLVPRLMETLKPKIWREILELTFETLKSGKHQHLRAYLASVVFARSGVSPEDTLEYCNGNPGPWSDDHEEGDIFILAIEELFLEGLRRGLESLKAEAEPNPVSLAIASGSQK